MFPQLLRRSFERDFSASTVSFVCIVTVVDVAIILHSSMWATSVLGTIYFFFILFCNIKLFNQYFVLVLH